VCGAVPLESVLAVESETMQETEAQTGETVQEPETESVEVDSESEETEPAVGAETELLTNTEPDKYANRISGVLWIDASEDGIYDSTESPLADYPVYLYLEGDTDNAVDTATTGADGKYEFINITPGRYVVGIKAEENGTEYLLPLVGVQNDNKFYFTPDWSKVISNSVDVGADTVVTDIDAAMRTMPQIQPMANTTYTIDITTQATVTSSITTQSIPGVSIASNVLTFANTVETDTYILTGTTTTVKVVVATGVTGNITLDGVNISNAVSPLQLQGTANTKLTLSGTNTLRCTGAVTTASTIQAGVYVNRDATLTIEGTGDLNAYGGFGCAGIGGIYTSASSPNGTVIINNGTVNATGGTTGAGIGGGYFGTGGTVIIDGGTVDARGATANGSYTGGAGIGGGGRGSGGTIIINSGNVTAVGSTCLTGHGGAGIGGGAASNTGTAGNGGIITINGGMVNATGSPTGSSAGIGGGTATSNATAGSSGTITITGGIVNATGGTSTFNSSSGPGIGAGENAAATSSGTITISGGTVTATAGRTTAPGIGSYSKTVNIGTVIFTGGSIYPTDSAGTVSVYPNPTNGTYGAPDPVGILTITSLAGQEFSIMTAGSVATYTYKGTGHTATAYPWLSYPGVITDAATAMSTTAASVTAPSTVNSAASSTATLNGIYYLNNTYPVTSAYFEWGTSTSYGTTIDMTSSVNISEITTAERSLSSPALTGLTPGVTYHYRLVIVTNSITVRGNDMTFTTPALAPSVDVTHDYPGGTTATLEGIYDLNGGTFVSGEFEISDDGGSTWSTPTGGTLTGSTTTPSVTLTGLTPGTTYHYRLTVTNSEGATTTVMQELTVSAKTVTISTEVTGAYANMDKSFTFTIYFQDSGGTALTGTFTYTGGVLTGSGATAPANGTLTLGSGGEATVTLTTGQTITIAGVATSAKVRVVQTTDANYTTSFKDSLDVGSTSGADTGVRNMTAADRTFDFTNTRSVVPGGISTGSGGIVLLSLMALLALATGLIITAVHRRRVGVR